MLLITHAGDVLHVPSRADLLSHLTHERRPIGHVVIDLERISQQLESSIVRQRRD
jgi:hypothetical protein